MTHARTVLGALALTLASCIPLAEPSGSLRSPTGLPTGIDATQTAPLLASQGIVGAVDPAQNMHYARAAHAATLLQSGEVLITGGFGIADNSYTETAELFDPTAGTPSLTARMASQRCCHTSTLLQDGRVLIAGGFNGDYLDSAEIYDPVTGEFTPTGPLTVPRMDHVAVPLDNGEVLLVGGVSTGWTFLASAELFDPATGVFTPAGYMSVPRESLTATKLNDGRVLIAGGHRGRHSQIVIYDSAEIYDPRDGTFTSTGRMSTRRHKHDAVLLADGRVLISGGSDETDDRNAYSSTEIFDPRTGLFTVGPDMPSVRYKHVGTSVLLPSGSVLLSGGAQRAAIYDPVLDTFAEVPGSMGTAPLSRLFATATLLKDGRVLITGGYGIGQGVSPGTWLYSP